ncbi:Dynamin family-domain-containing protein [Desarmillaria ectypa]|nr:Dynamin family-domain-containing protein [Desarmillaria ectypa]
MLTPMSSKENRGMSLRTNAVVIKPEPQEFTMPNPLISSINAYPSAIVSDGVKPEPGTTDNVAQVFQERGLPVPLYVQESASSSIGTLKAEPEMHQDVLLGSSSSLSEAQRPAMLYSVYNSASDIPYSPEGALQEGLGMVRSIQQKLEKLQLGSKLRQDVWYRELENLRGQTAPKTLIAICGATGAGKSSILNAILDDNIVPTSGMRACTAVVTEIAYHDKQTIDADVSFLTAAEWKEELSVLLQDLVNEDGTIKRSTDLKSDAGVAWQKVHAVYPTISQESLVRMTHEEIIARDPKIAAILGDTKKIVARNSKEFAAEIAKYIDSKDQSRGKKNKKNKKDKANVEKEEKKGETIMEKIQAAANKNDGDKTAKKKSSDKGSDIKDVPALWPLIRQVNVRCAAKALSTGSVLVDLPGVADANAARNNIAKDYMKTCACIWILAPITRAVDDKTARDLLGDAFKMQLMSDYDDHAITFIASKCDDISCSEVIRALHLEDDDDLVAIEDKIDDNTSESKDWAKKKGTAEKQIKEVKAAIKSLRQYVGEYEVHLKAIKDGKIFVPRLSSKQKITAGKKRKNARGGKKGSPKRHRSAEDESSSSNSDDSEPDSDSDSDSGSDSGNDPSSDEEDSDNNTLNSEDDGEPQEQETEESLKAKIKETKSSIKEARTLKSELQKEKKVANDGLATLKKNLAKLQKEKNAFCSLKRSEFSRDVLKEDFRVGLKDLDDAAAEERDPDNFNPSVNIRDYDAIDLPVFTCSSRDYVRLTKQVEGDGDPACFSNVEDTGIPALQEWCHALTLSSRERSARNFLAHLQTFSVSIQTYMNGISGVTATDREALRSKWESTDEDLDQDDQFQLDDDDPYAAILGGGLYNIKETVPKADAYREAVGITPRLVKDFTKVIEDNVENLKEKFREGLEDKCRTGAAQASAAAVITSDELAASMHWGTYRATLRRHGSFRRDLNVELLAPFTKNIAASWGKLFETDLFESFERTTLQTIRKVLMDVENSAAPGLKDRTKIQGELCLEEAKVALKKSMDVVSESMANEQKEISRCLAPHVQEELTPGYDRAMEERGAGSVARQKASFRDFISEVRQDLFEDGADVIIERLVNAASVIGDGLALSLGELAQKIEVNLAVLWEGAGDDPQQVYAHRAIIAEVENILRQVELWEDAEKLKKERDQEDLLARELLVDEDVEMKD